MNVQDDIGRKPMCDEPTGTAALDKPDLPGGLCLAAVGDIGLAVLPGQSPQDVLDVARVIQRELGIGFYTAQDVAREVLAKSLVAWPISAAPCS